MNSAKLLRKRFSLTQQDMADYLGISVSLYAMAERAWRELPAHASLKLTELEAACVKIEYAKRRTKGLSRHELDPRLNEQANATAEKLLEKAKYDKLKVEILERSFNKMIQMQDEDLLWLDIVDHKLSQLPESNAVKTALSWLKDQQRTVSERLLETNKAQAALQLQIDLLRMSVNIHETHHIKLKNNK